MIGEIPPWKRDGKLHPPYGMWKCEPERFEEHIFKFCGHNIIEQYINSRTFLDGCRISIRNAEKEMNHD